MSSIGAIGTFGLLRSSCLRAMSARASCGSPPRAAVVDSPLATRLQLTIHRLEGELAKPLGLAGLDQAHAPTRTSRPCRRGRRWSWAGPRPASSFWPAALRFSLTRSAWCLIVWIASLSGWTSPPISRWPSLVDVEDQPVLGDPLVVLDRPGRAGDRQVDALIVVIRC